MKHFFKLTILASVVTALTFGLSALNSVKKTKDHVASHDQARLKK